MKKLTHLSRSYGLAIVSIFLLVSTFQNCSEINFENQSGELSRVLMGNAELVKLSFDPDRSENRPKINVTAIVDNSDSMRPIQEKTGNALENVADKLVGFSGKARVYTTTWQNGEKPTVGATEYLLSYGNNIDKFSTNGNRGQAIDSRKPSVNAAPFSFTEINKIGIHDSYTPNGDPLEFSSAMDHSQFQNFKAQFNSSVNVGANGDTKEQGLCSLLKATDVDAEPGSFQAFVIVTNENDESDFSGCVEGSTRAGQVSQVEVPTAVSSSCDPGDAGCGFQYQVGFNNKEVAKIKRTYNLRTTKLKANYTLNDGGVSYKIKSRAVFRRVRMKYKRKQFQQYYNYQQFKYTYRDGTIINTEQVSGTPKQISALANGTCSSDGRLATNCTESDEQLLTAQISNYVPGSCSYVCTEQESGWGTFDHPDIGSNGFQKDLAYVNPVSCTSAQKNILGTESSIPENQISSCLVGTYDSYDTGEKSLAINKSSCSDNLNSADKQSLYDKYFVAVSNRSDIPDFGVNDLTYTNSCTPNSDINKAGVDLADISPEVCNGVDPAGQSPSGGIPVRVCDAQDAQDLGIDYSQIKSCEVVCVQSQSTKDSGWQLAGTASYDLLDSADACSGALGDDIDKITNCQIQDGTQSFSHADCVSSRMNDDSLLKAKNNATLTAQDILSHPSFASCSDNGYEVKLSSLVVKSGSNYMTGSETKIESKYDYLSGWLTKKYVNDTNNFAQEISNHLNQKFGSNFHIAAFAHRPENDLASRGGDGSCIPPQDQQTGEYFSSGQRFADLANALPNNMDLYSNCMSDYAENALSVVFDQIVRKVGQSYQIDMDPENDILYKVYFEMDSGEIVDVAKSLYEVNNAVITFKSERVLDGVSKVHTDIIKPIKELVEAAQQAKAQ